MEEGTSSEVGVSDGTRSDSGSVTYPYRTLLEDTSFPRCHLIKTPNAGTETYTRSLFMLGNGMPVWDPVGDLSMPNASPETGIMIGDVGLFTHEGNFVRYFNIFLPAENALQYRCPPDHIPLNPPEAADICMNALHFPPGTALVSKAVTASVHSSSPLDISFTVMARESGILVLPDGASREDLIFTTRIREYVQSRALAWYIFLNSRSRRLPFPNGSIYVITGHDKAATWAIGTSGSPIGSRANELRTIRYRNRQWEASRGIGAKVSPAEHGHQCALFVRGMRVAISIRHWTTYILHDQPPAIIHFYHILSVPVTGFRARLQSLMERRNSYEETSVQPQARERIFHVMEVILRVLLDEYPMSDVAIAEDSMWCGVVDNSDCSLSQTIKLIVRVLETHEIFTEDGMVTLVSTRPDSAKSTPSRFSNNLNIPGVLKQKYHLMRRRHQNLNKIGKVFPGQDVPKHMLS